MARHLEKRKAPAVNFFYKMQDEMWQHVYLKTQLEMLPEEYFNLSNVNEGNVAIPQDWQFLMVRSYS